MQLPRELVIIGDDDVVVVEDDVEITLCEVVDPILFKLLLSSQSIDTVTDDPTMPFDVSGDVGVVVVVGDVVITEEDMSLSEHFDNRDTATSVTLSL